MKTDNVSRFVRDFIADRVASGIVTPVPWLTNEIVSNQHPDIKGEDADFYRVCAFKHVETIVKRCVGKYDAAPMQDDRQIVAEGFEYLQVAYTVSRDGVQTLVPIGAITDKELSDRADEFVAMAKGCRAHAKEIRSYLMTRSSVAVAAQ